MTVEAGLDTRACGPWRGYGDSPLAWLRLKGLVKWTERLNVFDILRASMWEPESTSKVSGPCGATRRNLQVGV